MYGMEGPYPGGFSNLNGSVIPCSPASPGIHSQVCPPLHEESNQLQPVPGDAKGLGPGIPDSPGNEALPAAGRSIG